MTVVATVGSCQVELTTLGFMVTRDGAPVPDKVHPPALLIFAGKPFAMQYAAALDQDDHATAHQLIEEHGRWYA